jgi:hypothetical protein
MKVGDMVKLKNRATVVSGKIIEVDETYVPDWGAAETLYLVKYNNENLIPPRAWHTIREIESLYTPTHVCECGVDKVMPGGKHSDYCPKYMGE